MKLFRALRITEKEYGDLTVNERIDAKSVVEMELLLCDNREIRHWSAHSRAAAELDRKYTELRIRMGTLGRLDKMEKANSPTFRRTRAQNGMWVEITEWFVVNTGH